MNRKDEGGTISGNEKLFKDEEHECGGIAHTVNMTNCLLQAVNTSVLHMHDDDSKSFFNDMEGSLCQQVCPAAWAVVSCTSLKFADKYATPNRL